MSQSLRILLIERHEIIQAILQRMLVAKGHDVMVAGSGQAGVRVAQQQRPNLILMAADVADGHGNVVLRMFKTHPKTQHIPIIVLSAPETQDEPQISSRAGYDGYIAKPVMKKELYRIVAQVWQQASQRGNGNPKQDSS